MKDDLTQHENDLLKQGKQLLNIMNRSISIAATPRDTIVNVYQRYADLYDRAGDLCSAQECKDKIAMFQNAEHYIAFVEGFLQDNQQEASLSKRELIIVYYNLLEASIEAEDFKKTSIFKQKLDELLIDESE